MYDVQRTPKLVAWLAVLMRTEGNQAEGKRENPSNLSGVQGKTPRLVARLFVWFLVLEESKIDASDSTGDQMKVPRVVA